LRDRLSHGELTRTELDQNDAIRLFQVTRVLYDIVWSDRDFDILEPNHVVSRQLEVYRETLFHPFSKCKASLLVLIGCLLIEKVEWETVWPLDGAITGEFREIMTSMPEELRFLYYLDGNFDLEQLLIHLAPIRHPFCDSSRRSISLLVYQLSLRSIYLVSILHEYFLESEGELARNRKPSTRQRKNWNHFRQILPMFHRDIVVIVGICFKLIGKLVDKSDKEYLDSSRKPLIRSVVYLDKCLAYSKTHHWDKALDLLDRLYRKDNDSSRGFGFGISDRTY
jgi:hypothetical protein